MYLSDEMEIGLNLRREHPWVIAGHTRGVLAHVRSARMASKGMGYLYLLQVSSTKDGVPGLIKIGSTRNPSSRITTLCSWFKHYSEYEVSAIAISIPHANYRSNETSLHRDYRQSRFSGELFRVPFSEINEAAECLEYRDANGKFGEIAVAAACYCRARRLADQYNEIHDALVEIHGPELERLLMFDRPAPPSI